MILVIFLASSVLMPCFIEPLTLKVLPEACGSPTSKAFMEMSRRISFSLKTSIAWSGEKIEMRANSEERVSAVLDVFKDKLIKRSISLKTLDAGEPQASGKEYRISASVTEGISQDNAKKVSKVSREEGPKGVKAQIQGDELRVSSKSRDDLQEVIALLKGKDFDFAVQFTNYR